MHSISSLLFNPLFLSFAILGLCSPLQTGLQPVPPDARHPSSLEKRAGGPIKLIYSMMGDSFGSGIGAGKQWEQQETYDSCKRGDWGVGGQLFTANDWWSDDEGLHQVQYIACSGTKAREMEKDKAPWKGHDPQIKEFAVAENDAAIFWAGGNDAKFFNILDGCVFQFYGPFSPGCPDAIRDTLLVIQDPAFRDIFRQDFFEILDAAHPKVDIFTLYVLTYPRFFNAATDDCDDSHFQFWSLWRGPAMTKEIRQDMNDLMLEVNNILREVAAELGTQFQNTNKRVKVIDTDPMFEGHRFCEAGSKEPNPNNPNNYFFQLYDQDLDPDGNQYNNIPSWPNETATVATGAAALPNATECEAAINADVAMDFGEAATCRISIVLAKQNVTLEESDYAQALGSNYKQVEYGRIFHPKSKGHTGVKDAILKAINSTPDPPVSSAPPPASTSLAPTPISSSESQLPSSEAPVPSSSVAPSVSTEAPQPSATT